MAKYVLTFKKEGYIRYTSHLDMMRLFKRLFSRAGIEPEYSQGFNPHPKMAFCQPLSLGYESCCEMLEFVTGEEGNPDEYLRKLSAVMPEGLTAVKVERYKSKKSIAAGCYMAAYDIKISDKEGKIADRLEEKGGLKAFLGQEQITVLKRKKKTKEPIPVNIRGGIREMVIPNSSTDGDNILLSTKLAAGSDENLSPELLLKGFFGFLDLNQEGFPLKIQRTALYVKN